MAECNLSLERDQLSRNRIVSEMDRNFFVEAGAGSGKTTMLVNRMAAMVEAGIDISRICAITFTRAAAGEFYDRFQKLLIERSSPNYTQDHPERPGSLKQPDDLTRERCRDALQNIDLCFMGTIDSFCAMILSEHPSEARIPSDASIVTDGDAAEIYKQQYVKLCEGGYGGELKDLAGTFRTLHRNAQDVFVKGMSFVMNHRNVHFNFHEAPAADLDKDFEDERKELIRAVKCLLDHPELKYDKEAKSRTAWEKIGDIYKNIRRRWSSNYTSLMYGLRAVKDLRLIPEALNHYAVSLGPVFEPGGKWLECTVGREGGLLEKLQKLRYDASMTFLIRSVPFMEQALREKGRLTFFDDLYYLREMLKRDAGGDGKLIRYIYGRHSYFLIDEFQDTDPMQAEVFFYLTAEHPVPQWSDCVPRPGSLFIVGDPKQSIYRFRSADVASFLKVKRLFEKNGGSILHLSRNFRSTRTLCRYFNRVFTALLPEETENQSRFEEIPLPEGTEGEFEGVYTYKAYTGKAGAEHPDMTDPMRIADIIERLAGSSRFRIRGEKDREPRPIRYGDIMVVTYSKKALGPIMAELESRDIPARVEGDIPFAENAVLNEICSIFSAAADADDALALYGALTGKLIALTKEDILKFRANGGTVSLKSAFRKEGCTDPAALGVAEKIAELKELHAAAGNLSPAALFSRIMDDYRVYQTLPSENLEVVCYALELLRGAEKTGQVVSMKDGASFLKGLTEGRSEEERCLTLDADKDAVHMANLHKVKGLEAPVVILAAASGKDFPAAYRVQHGDGVPEGWLFFLEDERGADGKRKKHFQADGFPVEQAAEKEALAAEGQRLIYVAATRARNALILCNSITVSRGKETPGSRWSPVMEPGLPDIFDLIPDAPEQGEKAGSFADAAELYKEALETSVLNDRSAEAASYRGENPSRLHVLSKLSESPDQPEQEHLPEEETAAGEGTEAAPGAHRFPALLGTMTHKLMEMLVTSGGRLDVRAAIGEIIREYRTPGTAGYEDLFTEALLKAADTMMAGGYVQTNGLPQDLLGTLLSADEVCCEVPFCYADEAEGVRTVWNGVMDVVYAKDGRWHIVDYKTSADGSDLDARYEAQLSAYVKAFKATTGFDADALTYHIDI